MDGEAPNFIKKGASYFHIETKLFIFNDTLHFSAPCSYSQYLKQWGVAEYKSIFPYELYSSVEELEAAIEFPDRSAFFNQLKNQELPVEEYNRAAQEYNRRKDLPDSNPEKIRNMKGIFLHFLYN